MEKLDTDLKTFVNDFSEEKLSFEATLRVALQVLNILRPTHDYGTIHSDIKRGNLKINTNYPIDFGFA